MFNTKKFLQAVGMSILLTIVVSIIIGFLPNLNYGLFMIIQTIITYGSMGYFAASWNVNTPYTSAYLGAVLISVLNLILSNFVFNIAVFIDPDGIARSISLAIIVSLLFAVVTKFVRTKRVGAFD